MPRCSAVAREFSHAEVAFVFAASGADHDVRLRFFNARKEAPFVGHATIAAHAVLLALGRRAHRRLAANSPAPASSRSARSWRTARRRRRKLSIEFRQTVPELDEPLPFKTTLRVAEALKLPATQLHEIMPARIARKGSTPAAGADRRSTAIWNIWRRISTRCWRSATNSATDGFFVFAVESRFRRDMDRIAHVLPGARHPGGSRSAAMRTPCWPRTCGTWASSARNPRASSAGRAIR